MTIIDHPVRHPNRGVLSNIEPGAQVADAIVQAGLDWQVETRRLVAVSPNPLSDPTPIPDRLATVKVQGDDVTYLGTVGARYPVIDNYQAFLPFDPWVQAGILSIEQAGQTHNGRHVFMLMRLAQGQMLTTDPHLRMLLAKTSHDGSGSLRLIPWSMRLNCTNQIPSLVARKAGTVISIPHTGSIDNRLSALSSQLPMLIESVEEYERSWQKLTERQVSPVVVKEYTDRLFPMPVEPTEGMRMRVMDRRHAVQRLALHGEANDNIRGTAAAMFAAASEHQQWFSTSNEARRATRLLEGRTNGFLRDAWDLAHVG